MGPNLPTSRPELTVNPFKSLNFSSAQNFGSRCRKSNLTLALQSWLSAQPAEPMALPQSGPVPLSNSGSPAASSAFSTSFGGIISKRTSTTAALAMPTSEKVVADPMAASGIVVDVAIATVATSLQTQRRNQLIAENHQRSF